MHMCSSLLVALYVCLGLLCFVSCAQVQSALGDTSEKGGAIEKQVLNLYDQLYQSYVLANSTTSSESHFGSGLTNSGDLLNEMQIIVMENLETVVSVSTCLYRPLILTVLSFKT